MGTGSFKELKVWEKSVGFAVEVIDLMENLNTSGKHFRLKEQVESCVTSVAANIAEGKGRGSTKDYIRFLYIARGSLFECVTFLNIMNRKKWISDAQLTKLESKADEIGRMLKGLINRLGDSVS